MPLSERTGRELASLPLATMCAATRRLSHSGRRHAGLEVASSAWLQLVVGGDTEQLFTCRLSPVCRDRRFVSAHSHAGPASSPPPAAHRRLRGFLCRASYRGTRSTEGGLPRSRRQQAGAPPGPGVWSCQSKGQLVPRRPAYALEPIPPSQGGRPPQMQGLKPSFISLTSLGSGICGRGGLPGAGGPASRGLTGWAAGWDPGASPGALLPCSQLEAEAEPQQEFQGAGQRPQGVAESLLHILPAKEASKASQVQGTEVRAPPPGRSRKSLLSFSSSTPPSPAYSSFFSFLQIPDPTWVWCTSCDPSGLGG